MHRLLLALLLCFTAAVALAQDTATTRANAADKYLKVVPMSRLIDDMFSELSKQLPPKERAEFLRQMKTAVRVDFLERTARESMIKTFTTEELDALADFYGSKSGASAMKKTGIYMAEVMPAIHAEIQRSVQQLGKDNK